MKTSITEKTNIFHEHLTVEQAAGTKYGLRTECRFDCLLIIAMLRTWLLSWKESSGYQHDDSYVDVNGVIWSSQNWALDADVQFIVSSDGPSLNEIRWLLNELVDCHVAAESVDFLERYTGERMRHEEFEKTAVLPNKKMILMAIKKLEDYRNLSRISVKKFDKAIYSMEKSTAWL